MRLVDRAPVRSDFLTGLLRERDLQAKALSLAGPVFTGPNLLAHVPLQRGLLPKEPSVHVSVAVYLGPGGPAVTGKDWAKSLSLSLSLHLSRCVLVFKCCVSLWLFFCCVPRDFVDHVSAHDCSTHVLWWLELLWCSRFCRSGVVDVVEVPRVVWMHTR